MPLAHTVPRAYLVGFQDKQRGGIVVVDRNRPVEQQLRAQCAISIKKVATSVDTYVLRRSADTYDGPERALTLIEQSIPVLRANLRQGSLSDEDLAGWTLLAATQHARGRNRTLMLGPFRVQLGRIRSAAAAQGDDPDQAAADFVKTHFFDGDVALDPESLALLAVLRLIELTLNPLNSMYKCVITSAGDEFITSDEPVVWLNPIALKRGEHGAHRCIMWSQDCEVTYPLGRNHCMLMAYNPIIPDAIADEAVVQTINARTAANRENEAYVRPSDARGQDAVLAAFTDRASMLESLSVRFVDPHGSPIDAHALRERYGITDEPDPRFAEELAAIRDAHAVARGRRLKKRR